MNQHYWNRYLKFIEWCDQTQIWIGETYTEKHHIMPRCFDGDNSKDNLIRLPYRAHLLAHRLLYKALPCRQTSFSLNAMISTPSTHRNEKVNSRTIEFIKIVFQLYNREQTIKLWQKEDFRRKQLGKSRKSKTRSQTYVDKWKEEEYRQMQAEARKDSWTEERREKQSKLATEVNNKRWSDSENKKKQSEACKIGHSKRSEKDKKEAIDKFQKTLAKKSDKEKKIQSLKINISRWEKWLDQGFSVSKHGKHPLSNEKRASLTNKIKLSKTELNL